MRREAARALAQRLNDEPHPDNVTYTVEVTEPPKGVSPFYVRRNVDRAHKEKRD